MDNGKLDEKLKLSVIKSRDEINKYDESDSFRLNDEINTIPKLVAHLENDKNADIEGLVYFVEKTTGKAVKKKLNKTQFVEAYKRNSKLETFRESVDYFATDTGSPSGTVGGDDFTPLLGGPFNKQLYLYDYLKMHSTCFHAVNHDPVAKAAVDMIVNFTLGRGFRVDTKNKAALVIWRAFEEANDLQQFMRYFLREHITYGENFVWWLPQNQKYVAYNLSKDQKPPEVLIPRIRLVDPSTIWEIVTYPEDMSRVLYYQQVFSTQYQIYTGMDQGKPVSSSKFIYQQIPVGEMKQYKSNCMSNEKRGRSDLFPVLGYMKRLRDSVNYSLIQQQKNSAWAIDTQIDGSKEDIDAYIKSQMELGTIPTAGSEFVHSTKVTRTYLSNPGGKGGMGASFSEALSMICMGLGIPQNYFGTHLSGGSTRASAFVATEPVTKKFEERQQLMERVIKDLASKLFKTFGMGDVDIEVTFPDLITADRSAKLKDLAMAEQYGWISHERAASIAAKELAITEFDWTTEKETIENEKSENSVEEFQYLPLTTPPTVDGIDNEQNTDSSGINNEDRQDADDE